MSPVSPSDVEPPAQSSPVVYFDEVKIGTQFADASFVVDAESIDAYQRATADPSDRRDTDGVRLAPPTYAAVYTAAARALLPAPPGGIHAQQHFSFMRSVRLGDHLVTQTRIVDKYLKDDRRYVQVETSTRNSDGQLVSISRGLRIWSA